MSYRDGRGLVKPPPPDIPVQSLAGRGKPGERHHPTDRLHRVLLAVVARPNLALTVFTSSHAKWADANRAMHGVLLAIGLDSPSAGLYTMHSFRHTVPTLASQLQVPDFAIGIIGHWASTDPMVRRYDSARTTTELLYKD